MTIAQPHGGELKNLLVPQAEREALKRHSTTLSSWDLRPRQLCDIEMLLCGALSPLEGFLGQTHLRADALVVGAAEESFQR